MNQQIAAGTATLPVAPRPAPPRSGPARPAAARTDSGHPAHRVRSDSPVLRRARPSRARAAAAARLVGGGVVVGAAAPALPVEPRRSGEWRRPLRVVPPRTRTPAQRRRRARALLLAGAGLVAAVAFGLVYLHVLLAQRQFALDHLTTKVQADRATYQRLRLQVAQLGSPQHIISTAEGQLGMRQPASVTYLTPSVTIKGSPSAASPGGASQAATQAPAGDADWPKIKAQLAGSP